MTTAGNELGKTLKQRRRSLELTAKSGVSTSHIGRVERGDRFPSGHILRKIAKPLAFDESLLMTMAGYLPKPSGETSEEPDLYKRLDPYVAKVLSEEPITIQRTVVSLLTVVKTIAESLSGKQD